MKNNEIILYSGTLEELNKESINQYAQSGPSSSYVKLYFDFNGGRDLEDLFRKHLQSKDLAGVVEYKETKMTDSAKVFFEGVPIKKIGSSKEINKDIKSILPKGWAEKLR